MHEAEALRFDEFGSGERLAELLEESKQASYLRCYLGDLQCKAIVEEPHYFDRDYLAEFSSFYSSSARGYTNVCRRLHFFSAPVDRATLLSAASAQAHLLEGPADQLGANEVVLETLRDSYLGFCVVRPLVPKRLGRTVLRWYPYPPPEGHGPRVTEAARDYETHLVGIRLKVHGLAWQQQDSAVGTCATVAMWSMLHSSAFDDHHAIPTTVDITRAAHIKGMHTSRVFPSQGLRLEQLCEALQHFGLSPVPVGPKGRRWLEDVSSGLDAPAFRRDRFSSTCAAFLRSGYPILVAGTLLNEDNTVVGAHAVCATGFRSMPVDASSPVGLADSNTPHLYIHDDNLGPNVRFAIIDEPTSFPDQPVIALKPHAPTPRYRDTSIEDPGEGWPRLVPTTLLVAVHDDLRISPASLNEIGSKIALSLRGLAQRLQSVLNFTVGSRFICVRDYLGIELPRCLASRPEVLGRARMELAEKVRPMSLHLGLVRIAAGNQPLADLLCDTTDSDGVIDCFAHVTYQPLAKPLLDQIWQALTAAGYLRVALGSHVDCSQ